ncbi:MAG: hypothetical protein ACQEQO_06885 [Thermodesulfobacteriota bacterium]
MNVWFLASEVEHFAKTGGLVQLYALRFGSVPIVRATGGLDDTVEQYNRHTGKGTGFKFIDYKALAFLHSGKQAVRTYHHKNA